MGNELDEEEVQEIYDVWDGLAEDPDANQSFSEVARRVEANRDTVTRYIKEREEEERDDDDEIEGVPSLEGPPSRESLFPDPGAEAAEAFTAFFEQLNHKFSLGIKDKAVEMMAGEIRDSGMLPQPENVATFIERADSGIKNTQEVMWISERYRLWMSKYQSQQPNSTTMPMGAMGGGHPSTGLTEGGVNVGGQGGMGMPGMGAMGGAGAGMNPMMLMYQQMQQQIADLQEELRRSRRSGDTDMLKEKTEEFLERRLEQLIEAETTEEQEVIVQELRGLRQQLQQGGGAPPVELGENWRTDLITLAREGDIEFKEAKEILEEVGEVETNPAVLEKKYEKDIEKMRLDHETQRYERLGGLFETAIENAGRAMGEAIVKGGEEDEGEPEEAEPASEPAPASDGGQMTVQPDAPTEAGPCENCGETMFQAPNGTHCPSCELGFGQCDHCSEPVEIPPIGEASLGFCPECANDPMVTDIDAITLERTGDPEAEHACLNCEWVGTEANLTGEGLRCSECRSVLPIQRLNPQPGGVDALGAD